jgi:hypothetical protein
MAQVGMPVGPESASEAEGLELGGRSSMDLVRLSSSRFSFPLRYGNLRSGSERIELDGRPLVRGTDYTIDYKAGVVYMLKPFREGQSLRAQYKYDPANQVGVFGPQESNAAGFHGLKLEFNPQSSFFMGLGMTERLGDGTVLSSNVYGIANGFNFAGGMLKGVFMIGERTRNDAQSLMGNYGAGRAQSDEGQGTAIIQNFQSDTLGGKVNLSYQDVDSRFAGFDALKANGLTDAQVDAIKKERGLKRSEFSLDKLNLGMFGFSSNFKSVGDADGSIDWRSFAFNYGGLGFKVDSQKVDKTFKRFKDLSEADRQVLQKELGLERQIVSAGYAFGGGAVKFNQFGLTDDAGNGIERVDYGVESALGKFGYFSQTIDQAFSQFGGLRPEYDASNKFNVGQLQREQGLSRNGFFAETDKLGGLLRFTSSTVAQGNAGFLAQDFSGKTGRLTLDYSRREVDAGFNRLASLEQATEQRGHADAIANMVSPGKKADNNDLQAFLNSAGLDRELWRVGYDFGGGYTLRLDDASVQGARDELLSQAYTLTGPKYNFSYRSTNVGDQFDDVTRLTKSEQQVYGINAGLAKSDMEFGVALDKTSKLSFSRMAAELGELGASREVIGYKGQGIDVSYIHRSVDPEFHQVSQLMDPEKGTLAGMLGYDQSSLVAKLDLIPNVGVKLNWSDAENMLTEDERHWRETQVDWKVAPNTTLSAYRAEQLYKDDVESQIDRKFDRLLLQHDLGRYGIVSLLQEQKTFDGVDDDRPDSTTHRVAYQTNLSKDTKFETAQSETRFGTGDRETATTNTLNTKVTPKMGLSVTDTKILRDGDLPDSSKRDYGVWFDFGKGLRLSYGMVRDLNDPSRGTRNVKTELTAGQFAGIDVKSLQYTHDTWDGERNKTLGNVNLATLKPLDWGFLDNVELFYIADTLRDVDRWHKENRSMGISGSIGAFGLGIGYRSQVSPTGDRAIDRVFSFKTDTTGKASIRAELNYDVRTLPDNQQVAIRDFKLVAKLSNNWQLENNMLTNPIEAKQGVLLGGVAKDERINNFKLNYLGDKATKGAFVFEEMRNDKANTLLRKTGLDLTLFADNPSPLTLGYRAVQRDGQGPRSLAHEFFLRFEQRPGPNQSLSLFLGNTNFTGWRPSGKPLQDWSLRLDYGIRF